MAVHAGVTEWRVMFATRRSFTLQGTRRCEDKQAALDQNKVQNGRPD
jgi:hypothetical protein